MTQAPLLDRILRRINLQGPMPLSDYMQICMLDPAQGYYTTRDPLGANGDFITAPEISQMFGELIGLALAQTWMDHGSPAPFTLAEAGPGRGTLMADILRATRGVPGFHDAMRLVLIEASPTLRRIQGDTLADYTPAWTDRIEDLPKRPLFFVANEFFDALPIRQAQRMGDGWAERVVTADDTGPAPGLTFALTTPTPLPELAHRLKDTTEGDVVEWSPAGQAIAATIGQRIATYGGAALIFDYGDWRSQGDTFQALRDHQPVSPFEAPGSADLTAHVDFEALARAAAPAVPSLLTPQGVFLERLGITARAQALAKRMTGSALENHIAAHRRLTHPQEMGTLFKVLALTATGRPPVAGMTDPERPFS
ncbi:SAM-dependent methyltransferase [Pseudooceanicola nitratireducens]|uniref:class I SAM-dependent methyltransferase n=1 Tax=Pseudooceanicola nitratireducens TaxID=517719 RepID=UPI001C9603A2|nr:SAM-dependent methyltransferase [Pseudooceanicola nitratireducens]MBY6165174.1 SAM-dependent methyltransferase [Pseudooceanicola nitratireducens]